MKQSQYLRSLKFDKGYIGGHLHVVVLGTSSHSEMMLRSPEKGQWNRLYIQDVMACRDISFIAVERGEAKHFVKVASPPPRIQGSTS